MKKSLLISIFLISTNTTARTCDISPYADLEKIIGMEVGNQKDCLKSLAFAPTTPPYPKSYFQKLGSEEVFVINCYLGEEDYKKFDRFFFLTDGGIKSLKYPKYFYKIGIDTVNLPRNVVHFKDGASDYYMVPDIVGQPTIHTSDKLPQIGQQTGNSITRIRNEYIKKYEDYLRSKGQISAINLELSDEEEVKKIMPCFEKKQRDIVTDYMRAKFQNMIPSYNTLVKDHNLFKDLTTEASQKYQRSWFELKDMIVKDLLQSNPTCKGVIEEKDIESEFEKNWGENKKLYEVIHHRFSP